MGVEDIQIANSLLPSRQAFHTPFAPDAQLADANGKEAQFAIALARERQISANLRVCLHCAPNSHFSLLQRALERLEARESAHADRVDPRELQAAESERALLDKRLQQEKVGFPSGCFSTIWTAETMWRTSS